MSLWHDCRTSVSGTWKTSKKGTNNGKPSHYLPENWYCVIPVPHSEVHFCVYFWFIWHFARKKICIHEAVAAKHTNYVCCSWHTRINRHAVEWTQWLAENKEKFSTALLLVQRWNSLMAVITCLVGISPDPWTGQVEPGRSNFVGLHGTRWDLPQDHCSVFLWYLGQAKDLKHYHWILARPLLRRPKRLKDIVATQTRLHSTGWLPQRIWRDTRPNSNKTSPLF